MFSICPVVTKELWGICFIYATFAASFWPKLELTTLFIFKKVLQ